MFDILVKSAGGIDGIVKMLAGAAGLTPDQAKAYLDEYKEMLHNLVARQKAMELNISLIAASISPKHEGNCNGQCSAANPDRPHAADPGACFEFADDYKHACYGCPDPGACFTAARCINPNVE